MTTSTLSELALEISRDITAFGNPLIIAACGIFLAPSQGVVLIIGLVVVELICSLLKLTIPRERPVPETASNIISRINASSFPSAHAARTAWAGLLLAGSLPAAAILLIPLLVGISRVMLRKHFAIDVAAGWAIGLLIFIGWSLL